MSLDAETVKKLARLARLRVEPVEVEPLGQELSSILSWVEQLGTISTEGVEPMSGARMEPPTTPRRDDQVNVAARAAARTAARAADGPETVLSNAPARTLDFFTVPKVVE